MACRQLSLCTPWVEAEGPLGPLWFGQEVRVVAWTWVGSGEHQWIHGGSLSCEMMWPSGFAVSFV